MFFKQNSFFQSFFFYSPSLQIKLQLIKIISPDNTSLLSRKR